MVYSWRKAPFQHSVNEKESLYAINEQVRDFA